MRVVSRFVLGTVGALAAVGSVAGPVAAEKPEPFPVECGGVAYTITSGNGKWSVGSDTDSSTHFIPKAFTFTVTDQSGDVVFSESIEKKGHRNQETIVCTFSGQEDGLTFSGTATVVKRP